MWGIKKKQILNVLTHGESNLQMKCNSDFPLEIGVVTVCCSDAVPNGINKPIDSFPHVRARRLEPTGGIEETYSENCYSNAVSSTSAVLLQ